MKKIITKSVEETRELGKNFSQKIIFDPTFFSKNKSFVSAIIICLEGDLGSGKTTFTQGLLEGLGVEGPYTSPTFLIMKEYKAQLTIDNKHLTKNNKKLSNVKCQMSNVFHLDAYRVKAEDILDLGWDEIIANKNNIVIVEWPERIKKIIPDRARWIKFEWVDENKRKITM